MRRLAIATVSNAGLSTEVVGGVVKITLEEATETKRAVIVTAEKSGDDLLLFPDRSASQRKLLALLGETA